MDKLFLLDRLHKTTISYRQFLSFLKEQGEYSPLCLETETQAVYEKLLLSLLADDEIVLVDSDSYETVYKHFPRLKEYATKKIVVPREKTLEPEELLTRIRNCRKWRITLHTSGTTGTPKRIVHDFGSITRNVKVGPEHMNDIWGLAYHPAHIGGIQVFFQALLNLNPIVLLYKAERDTIFSLIDEICITHISGTPTFFRLLLPADRRLQSVRKVIFGGEKFDPSLVLHLKTIFPNAQFRNIYASTEAGTLLSSDGESFSIKERFADSIRIEDNELLIHESLLGGSDDLEMHNGWYPTGDLVEILSLTPLSFRFIQRKSEAINVGGSKVNPLEVEEILNQHPKVRKSRVFGIPNRLVGNVLACEIELMDAETTEKEIRDFLKPRLLAYKIPRIFSFNRKINLTGSGKIRRSS